MTEAWTRKLLKKKGPKDIKYCPFTRHDCTDLCEWFYEDACVIWAFLRALERLKA